jgi:cytochrome c biogenesis protein CcdA
MTETYPDIPPVDPAAARAAKMLHAKASIVRFLGLAIILIGVMIAAERLANIPWWSGLILIALGLAQMLLLPLLMVRQFVRERRASEAPTPPA